MTVEASHKLFYPGLLVLLAGVYTIRAITWYASPTPGRAAGVEWVSGWMSTQLVAGAWVVVAALCAVGLVGCIRSWPPGVLAALGVVVVAIPAIIGGYFIASTIVFYADPTPGWPPPPQAVGDPEQTWRDRGSKQGWVTGSEYILWSLTSLWGLLVHTGAVQALLLAFAPFRGKVGDRDNE